MQTSIQNQYNISRLPGSLAVVGSSPDNATYTAQGSVAKVATLTVAAGATSVNAVTLTDDYGRTTTIDPTGLDDTSETTTATGLLGAMENDGLVGATVSISQASGVLSLTGLRKGANYTLSSSDANVTAADVTAASDGPKVPFGVVVVQKLDSNNRPIPNQCDVPRASENQAKVVTIAPTAENSVDYAVTVSFPARPDLGNLSATYRSDGTATDAEIVDAFVEKLNEQAPANSVIASNSSDDLVITAEIAGLDFIVHSSTTGANAFAPSTTTANVTARALGIALLQPYVNPALGTAPEYPVDAPILVNLSRENVIALCDDSAAVNAGDDIFYRQTAAGSERLGAVRADSDGNDCLLLAGWRAASDSFTVYTNGVSLTAVELEPVR